MDVRGMGWGTYRGGVDSMETQNVSRRLMKRENLVLIDIIIIQDCLTRDRHVPNLFGQPYL